MAQLGSGAMIRALAVVVGIVFVMADGAVSAAAPTKSSWAASANRVCAAINSKARSLPALTTTTLLSDIEALLKLDTLETERLDAIPQPTSEAKLIASLLAVSRKQDSIVRKQVVPALRRGTASWRKPMTQVSGPLGDQFNSIARKLGATVCAVNSQPGSG